MVGERCKEGCDAAIFPPTDLCPNCGRRVETEGVFVKAKTDFEPVHFIDGDRHIKRSFYPAGL